MKRTLIGAFALMTISMNAFAAAPATGCRRRRQSRLYVGPERSLSVARGLDGGAIQGQGADRRPRQIQRHARQERGVDAGGAVRDQRCAARKSRASTSMPRSRATRTCAIAENQERVQLAQALQSRFGEKTAWLSPEVIAVGAEKVHEFEKQSPELAQAVSTSISTTSCAARRTRSAPEIRET